MKFTTEQLAQMKITFNAADTDKNGKVTQEELKGMAKKDFPNLSDDDISKLVSGVFDKMDTDKSGEIDFNEFCKANGGD